MNPHSVVHCVEELICQLPIDGREKCVHLVSNVICLLAEAMSWNVN